MRRETSTVVVLVGEVGEGLLAGLGQSPNVSVARAPVAEGQESAGQRTPPRSGWERGALAMREAARRAVEEHWSWEQVSARLLQPFTN